jgi:hypothetical protein
MDLTIGSGWSFGGPYITPALAASRLRSERREIAPGVTSITPRERFDGDVLVAAFIAPGSLQEAAPGSCRLLQIPDPSRPQSERGSIPCRQGQARQCCICCRLVRNATAAGGLTATCSTTTPDAIATTCGGALLAAADLDRSIRCSRQP